MARLHSWRSHSHHDAVNSVMRLCPSAIAVATVLLLSLTACSNHEDQFEKALQKSEIVAYQDRNKDGKVDLERHRFPGFADCDWENRDDNFDGVFEGQWRYEIALRKTTINVPAPTNVVISLE